MKETDVKMYENINNFYILPVSEHFSIIGLKWLWPDCLTVSNFEVVWI